MAPQALSGITVVWRCISLVAGQIASLPLVVERLDGSVGELPPWLRQPDPEWTLENTISDMVVSLMTDGNAFVLIGSRDSMGRPSSFRVLDPLSVQVRRADPTGGPGVQG